MASMAIGEWPNLPFIAPSEPGPVDLPRNNPCAQCGRPIASPDWVETSAGRADYLWHCHACNYRFEAIAFSADHGALGA